MLEFTYCKLQCTSQLFKADQVFTLIYEKKAMNISMDMDEKEVSGVRHKKENWNKPKYP